MKKLLVILSLIIFTLFVACGEKKAATTDNNEVKEIAQDKVEKKTEVNTETKTEANTEAINITTDLTKIPCKKGTEAYTDAGTFDGCVLSKDATIQGIQLTAETELYFDEKGKLYRIYLNKDSVVKGKSYKKDTALFFDANGNITEQ